MPVGARDDREHRLLGVRGRRRRARARRPPRRRSRVTVGTKRTMTRVDRGSLEQERQHRARTSPRSRRRACRRGSRRSPPAERSAPSARARLVAQLRQLETRGLAGVGAEDPEPARVRQDRDPPAVRLGLRSRGARRRRSAPRASAARITPAWRKSASTAASEPASAAVCELAARCPVVVVPLLSARIGFRRATRRASRPNRRGLPNDST